MTGSNDNMTVVTTVVSSLDGNDPSLRPYNWTCPDVDPYSSIYFYQVSIIGAIMYDRLITDVFIQFNDMNDQNDVDTQWTTRFAVIMAFCHV